MQNTSEIKPEVLKDLFADLALSAQPGGQMEGDDFRYESFARRLVAAEYGRPDAVKWALEWHADLLVERLAIKAAAQEKAARLQDQHEFARAELLNGRAGNPLYQSFLDTVEEPAKWMNNAEYFVFHGQRQAEFQQVRDGRTFAQFVRDYADQHLATRLTVRPGLTQRKVQR